MARPGWSLTSYVAECVLKDGCLRPPRHPSCLRMGIHCSGNSFTPSTSAGLSGFQGFPASEIPIRGSGTTRDVGTVRAVSCQLDATNAQLVPSAVSWTRPTHSSCRQLSGTAFDFQKNLKTFRKI